MHSDKISILLIEDNIPDSRLIKEFLSGASDGTYHIEYAGRLSEAIKKILENKFDAALLDLNLPDSEGLNTVYGIIQRDNNIPLIILTGLDDLSIATKSLSEGVQDYLVKGQFDDETLKRSIRYAIERKKLVIEKRQFESELNDLKNKYRFLSFHDSLTGLYNRLYFDEELKRIDSNIKRFEPVSIISIDINKLKKINDRDGHEQGDILIKETAKVLSLFIRKTDVLARIGGDEFCAILSKADLSVANKRKKDLNEKIKAYNSQSEKIRIDISIGIASTQEDESFSVYDAIKISDERMYANKRLIKSKKNK
jgi:diguanylate cyclase (GGDEF)-like protein